MGLHVSARSRYRFEFPTTSGAETDATGADKTGWAGPFTRPQLVELLWRVQEIRVQASGDYSFSTSEGDITGTISLDVTMIRQNAFFNAPANELKVFGNNLGSQNPVYAGSGLYDVISWRGVAANMYAYLDIYMGKYWLRKDAAGYWLATGSSFNSPISLTARAQKEVPWGDEGASSTVTLDVYASAFEQGTLNATLNLSSGGVAMPLQTKVPFEGSLVGATSASLEITKWFQYATTA